MAAMAAMAAMAHGLWPASIFVGLGAVSALSRQVFSSPRIRRLRLAWRSLRAVSSLRMRPVWENPGHPIDWSWLAYVPTIDVWCVYKIFVKKSSHIKLVSSFFVVFFRERIQNTEE